MAGDELSAAPAPRNVCERDLEFWQLHAVWKLAEMDGGPAERELAFRDLMLAVASSASAVACKVAALGTFPPSKAAEELRPGMTPMDIIEWDLGRAVQFEVGLR